MNLRNSRPGAAVLLAFLTLALSGCSGTRTRNPIGPVAPLVSIELGGSESTNVTNLSVCITAVSLAPAHGGSPVSLPVASGSLTVSTSSQALVKAAVPAGNYTSITATLNSSCAAKSLAWTNSNGTFNLTGQLTLAFPSSFSVATTTQALTLNIQPFVNQLAAALTASAGRNALAGTTGTVSVTASTGVNLEVPIEVLDVAIQASGSGPTIWNQSQTAFDPSGYDGQVSVYLEAVGNNDDSAADHTVTLVDSLNAPVPGASYTFPKNTTNITRFRSQAFAPPAAGVYRVSLDAAGGSNFQIYTVRLIVQQVGATRTKIYVPLVNSNGVDIANFDGQVQAFLSGGTGYMFNNLGEQGLWIYNDVSAFETLAPDGAFSLDAVIGSISGTLAPCVALGDTSNLSTYGTTCGSTGSQLQHVASAPFAIPPSFDYLTLMLASSNAGRPNDTAIYRGGLWIQLVNLAHAETYLRVGAGLAIGSPISDFYTTAQIDTSAYGPATQFFALFNTYTASASCTPAIVDAGPDPAPSTASSTSQLSSISLSNAPSSQLFRMPTLSLVDGDDVYTAANGAAGCVLVESAIIGKF